MLVLTKNVHILKLYQLQIYLCFFVNVDIYKIVEWSFKLLPCVNWLEMNQMNSPFLRLTILSFLGHHLIGGVLPDDSDST